MQRRKTGLTNRELDPNQNMLHDHKRHPPQILKTPLLDWRNFSFRDVGNRAGLDRRENDQGGVRNDHHPKIPHNQQPKLQTDQESKVRIENHVPMLYVPLGWGRRVKVMSLVASKRNSIMLFNMARIGAAGKTTTNSTTNPN